MGKLLEGIGQIIVGLNYLISSFLVLANYGFFWGLVSFFIPPIGAVAAPFFVNTWGFFLIGAGIFILGSVLNRSDEKRLFNRKLDYFNSLDKELADRLMEAEVVTSASAAILFPGMQPNGPGKLLGSPSGELFWIGDSGYQFDIERNLKEWGKSGLKLNSNDLFITLTTLNEFEVKEDDALGWITWLKQHYPEKSNQ